jgi:hypothetical protein
MWWHTFEMWWHTFEMWWHTFEMWWHTRRNQILPFGETDESISIGGRRQFIRLLAAEVCALAIVMLDTPCSEVVTRVLATHSIRQFPLHFASRASPCAITFELDSTHSIDWPAVWPSSFAFLSFCFFLSVQRFIANKVWTAFHYADQLVHFTSYLHTRNTHTVITPEYSPYCIYSHQANNFHVV